MDMQDLNSVIDGIKEETGGGSKYALFQDGIDTYDLRPKKGGAAQQFWLLPGVDARNGTPSTDPNSWFHHIEDPATNKLNPALGSFARFHHDVGHGSWKDKETITSLQNWGETCPADLVYQYALNNAKWKYLTESVKREGDKYASTIFRAAEPVWMLNIVMPAEVHGQAPSHKLAKVKRSTLTALANCITQQAAVPDNILEQNPMARYVVGDVTNPGQNLMLEVSMPPKAKAHQINYFATPEGTAVYMDFTAMLPNRYPVYDLDQILLKPSPQDTVDKLGRVLNGRAPDGTHEYQLLHEALGALDVSLPEVPAKQEVAQINMAAPAATQFTPANMQAAATAQPAAAQTVTAAATPAATTPPPAGGQGNVPSPGALAATQPAATQPAQAAASPSPVTNVATTAQTGASSAKTSPSDLPGQDVAAAETGQPAAGAANFSADTFLTSVGLSGGQQ